MTQEERIQKIKMVAGFMGIKVIEWKPRNYTRLVLANSDGNFDYESIEDYTPDTDWNQLMPVVEKISRVKVDWINASDTDTYYPRTFGMLQQDTGLPMVRINANRVFVGATLKEATWVAVTDFIEFYNT